MYGILKMTFFCKSFTGRLHLFLLWESGGNVEPVMTVWYNYCLQSIFRGNIAVDPESHTGNDQSLSMPEH